MLKIQERLFILLNKFIYSIVSVLACVAIVVIILSHFEIIDSSAEAIVMPILGLLILREGLANYKKHKIWGGVLILVSVAGFLIKFMRYVQS